jgi:hypothetical protein
MVTDQGVAFLVHAQRRQEEKTGSSINTNLIENTNEND